MYITDCVDRHMGVVVGECSGVKMENGMICMCKWLMEVAGWK